MAMICTSMHVPGWLFIVGVFQHFLTSFDETVRLPAVAAAIC